MSNVNETILRIKTVVDGQALLRAAIALLISQGTDPRSISTMVDMALNDIRHTLDKIPDE